MREPNRRKAYLSLLVTLISGCFSVAALGAAPTGGTSTAAGRSPSGWPQWRGPNRDDHSPDTGLLKEWPKDGPRLAWKAGGIGKGYSSVSIGGKRIYTMGDADDGGYVYALALDGGKKLWSTKVGKPGGNYPGTRSTPTVDEDRVYALGQWGDLVCLDADTGDVRWHKNLEKDFGGKMMSGWGYAESVLVDGEHVVCTPGGPKGTVLALNKNTGDVVWRTTDFTDDAAYSSLVPAEIGGVHQYVQLTDASVVGVAADSGHVLWRADRKGETAVIPTPIVYNDCVFVTSGYGVGCNLFRVSGGQGGKFSVKQVYANKDLTNHHGGVVRVGDYVYGTDERQLVCMDLKTGKVKWKDRSVGKGSIVYADGNLYVRSEGNEGTVALVEATPEGYREKGRFDQPNRTSEQSWAHPVVAEGKLYLRDQDSLFCYDVKAK